MVFQLLDVYYVYGNSVADPGFGGRGSVNCHKQGRSTKCRGGQGWGGKKWKSENALRTSEALQNPYFVRLY